MLLLDANISPRISSIVAEALPGAVHVREIGLAKASDREILEHASLRGLVVVTKDADFAEMAIVSKHAMKVVWLRGGNTSTDETAAVLLARAVDIRAFAADPELRVLTLR